MRVQGLEIKKGDRFVGARSASGGVWEVIDLKPFCAELNRGGISTRYYLPASLWLRYVDRNNCRESLASRPDMQKEK